MGQYKHKFVGGEYELYAESEDKQFGQPMYHVGNERSGKPAHTVSDYLKSCRDSIAGDKRGMKNKKKMKSPGGYPSGQSIEDKEETVKSWGIDNLDLRTTEAKEADQTQLLAMFSESPVIARHVNLLKQRRTRTQALLVSLAKQMFVLSLYLETETVIVQNGKFGVKLTVGTKDLGVQLFTKGTDAETIDWKDFVGELVQSRSVSSVESAVKSRRQRRRSSEHCTVGGYNVNGKGVLLRNSIPKEYVPLIPTAKLLVDEELVKQEEATKSELAYLEELDEMTPEWRGEEAE